MPTPLDEYRARAERWRTQHTKSEQRSRQLGNARLATGLAAVAIAALAIGAGILSPWWLLLPLIVFVVLAVLHDSADKQRDAALRGTAYYDRALARIENRWVGKGHQGEAFRDPKHLYADDLDLLGPASAFELLSTSRTATGDRMLAEWLLAPAAPEVVKARQAAVTELRERLDLREDIALMGEDIRTAIDDQALKTWGQRPAVRFFPGARWIALALACAALSTFVLFLSQVLSLRPFLAVVLAELIFGLAVRDSVRNVSTLVSTPARELKLVRLLLERLEKEPFQSPRLQQLTQALDLHGLTASAEIRRLERFVEYLDSARNQFFRLLAAPLVWIPQFTMAIEKWRQDCGPHIAEWVAAVGEFEALCSLATFAYERPDAVFPELVSEPAPLFDGAAVRHPLLPHNHAVGNDVKLDSACSLWIVSGSNMSGKSTLLRAVGLNAALAWAGAPVCCARLRVSPLRIGASIRVNDSLADNKSRFYAEISRLRDIVDLARAGQPTLFLLDELLSGTNSHDRRIGAAAVIQGLVERGAIGLVTTHDLALAEITATLGERARNVHFEDHIENGEIHFDYHLRTGVVERSNALELMRAVGLDV
ncbi:MAG: DNA mismatch repair protein MutS [Acidobacteriota bacterium]|nr:DNA mismatch repair protein MutS [Acidobacteriota bacterium]